MINLAMQHKQDVGELCDLSGMDRLGPYWIVTTKRWEEATRRHMDFAICADEMWVWSIARFDSTMKFHMPFEGDVGTTVLEEWIEKSRKLTYLIKAGTILASTSSDLYAFSLQHDDVECIWLR